jgi:hypothetical protein
MYTDTIQTSIVHITPIGIDLQSYRTYRWNLGRNVAWIAQTGSIGVVRF